MFKKIICIFFVFLLITISPISTILSINNNVYGSVDDIIINNPSNRYLIGTMLIASGMMYKNGEELLTSVNDFIDEWNDHETGWQMPSGGDNDPKKWAEILLYLTSGAVTVYDIGLDKTKEILELPQNLMNYFKLWVNSKYNPGSNTSDVLKGDGTLYLSNKIGISGYLLDYKNNISFYKVNINGQINYAGSIIYRSTNNDFYSSGNGVYSQPFSPYTQKWTDTLIYVKALGTTPGSFAILDTTKDKGILFVESGSTVTLPQEGQTIIGTSVVDDEDYVYTHNQTGTSTIVKPDGATESDLINKTYQDIASTNVNGIPTPGTTTPTLPGEVVEYPIEPTDNIATEEDFDNSNKRALYQKKFPFSLPWDLKSIFNLINAPSLAPRWEIDILPQSLKSKIGITKDTKFVFDMSQFPLIPKVTRFFSLISFCLTLIFITRTIIKS